MKSSILVIVLTFISLSLCGQIINNDGKGIIYDDETTIDLRLHTNGWSVGINQARIVKFDLMLWKGLEFGEIKHPKQDQRTFGLLAGGASSVGSKSYVYGKQNNLFTLKYNIGRKHYFSDKAERKGAVIGVSYSAGPMLGLVKPYLLDIINREVQDNGSVTRELRPTQYNESIKDIFLDPNEISGPSGLWKGWGQLKVQPGIHGKAAMHIDWGGFEQYVKGLEMGIQIDLFFKKVPIMVLENNSQVYLNLFINAHLGKRK